ncbi:unnamed protein product [Eruca vesicaria subsp. sativa]|uniref:Uncharacterized protein n=1 Tax=Eruca vesicaria subsp. sativa TaxID=29727 RepID=A0ABC8JWB5_ERUVS|nr:unnamed protein product [Eruca vesicaria subsp. sativa]
MNPMFYSLLALTAVFAATSNALKPVLDTDGDYVFAGSYYVLPAIFGAAGGGLNLASRGSNQCPLFVGQEISEVDRGIPVKFSNWRYKVAFVPESTNINIEMDVKATICVQSTYWWVTAAPSGFRTLFVTAGPNPEAGEDSSRSFFQIKQAKGFPDGYHIMFCPNGNDCRNVGIIVDEYGVRRLALSSTPFPFVFMKANGIETSSKPIMSII